MSMLQFLNQPSQLTKFKIIQELMFQEAYPSDFSPCSPCKRVAASRCRVLSGHLRRRCTTTSHRITITDHHQHHQIINSFQTQTPKIYFTKSLTLFPPNHHHPPPPCSTTRTAGHRHQPHHSDRHSHHHSSSFLPHPQTPNHLLLKTLTHFLPSFHHQPSPPESSIAMVTSHRRATSRRRTWLQPPP